LVLLLEVKKKRKKKGKKEMRREKCPKEKSEKRG